MLSGSAAPLSPPEGAAAPRTSRNPIARMLGPAFVAAIAYVDPGNVAANLSAGAQFGYLLVWVLVLANVMAVIVQYLSAKLGAVTGRSLPELLGDNLGRPARLAFWAQAQLTAIATDMAEVIGGAIALEILFGLDLWLGGLIVGAISLLMLLLRDRQGQRRFEHLVIGFLLVITVGFLAGLVTNPPDSAATLGGLVPRFEGRESVLLATSMLGATVMPHAIYLHSSLVTHRHGTGGEGATRTSWITRVLRASRWDVVLSLVVAGSVNIGMLLFAAAHLPGVEGTDTLEGASAALEAATGPVIGTLFAVGLLASGLASTSVGSYAGAEIMHGLLRVNVPLVAQRLVTLAPAVALLAVGIDPTRALILSQVVLSLALPFALVPLVVYTGRRSLLGEFVNGLPLRVTAWVVAGAITALNIALVVMVAMGLG